MYTDRSPGLSFYEKGLYTPVPPSEVDSEQYNPERPFLSPVSDFLSPRFKPPRQSRMQQCDKYALTIFNLVIFITSVVLFVALPYRNPDALNDALRQVSAYSPILENAKIPLVDTKVAGTLYPLDDGTDGVGRAEPGPKTDALWAELEQQRMFAIPAEEVRRMGKDPAKTVKFPAEYGLGDDAYMASLDVSHQLHCLNMLRTEAFKDYYFDGEKYHMDMYSGQSPPQRVHSEHFWMQMRHCTDMLLQSLMCHADTEMIPMTWMEGQEKPAPDFSIEKKCKSFDAVMDWRNTYAQPLEKLQTLQKPQDLVAAEPMHWKLLGNGSHTGDNVHHPVW